MRTMAQWRGGAAYVGLMFVAVSLLGGMLALNTTALLSLGATSRAFELARQDRTLATRLERMTREAAQAAFGTGTAAQRPGLQDELRTSLARVGFGDVRVSGFDVLSAPPAPTWFPDLSAPLRELGQPSRELLSVASPQLRQWMGDEVAESPKFTARFSVTRDGLAGTLPYAVEIDCRLVAVPLTRFRYVPYDLPQEIGAREGAPRWPSCVPPDALPPLGLVPARDPADVARRDGAGAVVPPDQNARPLYFRYAATLVEAYQHVFSAAYLQRMADYAGVTHFVSLGGAYANPALVGGREVAGGYELDVGVFGAGTYDGKTEVRNAVVFCATATGQRLILSDSRGASDPILIAAVGPSDVTRGPLTVELAGDLERPLILIGCKVTLLSPAGGRLNGALLLDAESSVSTPAGPIEVGHVSHWAGGPIRPEQFRLGQLPEGAAALSPRVVYVATSKRLH